ncbi:protein POF1B isoform 2-T2 [Pholidichthys leucotaenia]
MSVHTKKTTTTYRTVNVASAPETVTRTVISARPVSPAAATLTATVVPGRPMSPGVPLQQVSTVPYATVNGAGYETVRYLVPVQQAVQQPSYVVMQQPMLQQMVQPMYLQGGLSRLSVSSLESDQQQQQTVYRHHSTAESLSGKSSVFSTTSSPIKSPEPEEEEEEEEEVQEEEEDAVEVEEVEIVNVIQTKPPQVVEKISRRELRTELKERPEPTKLDTRYFGELLADVYRKNCDIHSCISDHVSKIRGQKHQLDPSNDYKMEKEQVEALIPKGASELTKQQIRYLLQTRLTADKSMRLLLSTFNSLREELLHMSEDLRRLESEKESLERDLSFKADQARQYDCLLEAVRENNRELQLSLKEASSAQRSLEGQLMSTRSTDSSREFKIKELEGRLRALEKENEMLRHKMSGQSSSTTLHIKTEELSRQYKDQLNAMKREKDEEIERLKSQMKRMHTEVSTERSSSDRSLQLKISELLATLEQRQTTITRQEEEIRRLMQDRTQRTDSSKNVTKTIITKRYRNQYPILGLLSDDYQVTSPVKEAKTIVIERTGEMIKEE